MGKGLNDAIHGDRSKLRGYSVPKEPTWDDFEAGQSGSAFRQSQTWGTTSGKKGGGTLYDFAHSAPSCYESHPPLKLPGTELVIYGGSCLHPKVKDADVYIGFDMGMRITDRQYPWVEGDEIKFEISDMSIPKDPASYDKLIGWTKTQVESGRKVHCGCIGGHGRTGMFLAALVSKFGEKDAISYVRQNYCEKGVESSTQVKFLADRYGITPAKGAKDWSKPASSSLSYAKSDSKGGPVVTYKTTTKVGKSHGSGKQDVQTFNFVTGQGCIW